MKIRTKILLVFFPSILLAIGSIMILLAWQLREDALQHYEDLTSMQLEQANKYIELFWQEAENNIAFLAALPDSKKSSESFPNFSDKTGPTLSQRDDFDSTGQRLFDIWQFVMQTHPYYAEIFYGFPNGSYGSSLETEIPGGFDSRKRAWFIEGMKHSGQFTKSPAYRSFTGDLVAAITSKIKDSSDFIGFASFDVKLTSLAELIKSLRFGQTGKYLLLEESGRILVNTSDKDSVFKMVKDMSEPGLVQLFSGQDGLSKIQYNDREYIANVLTGYNNYKIIAMADAGEVYASVNSALVKVLGVGLVLLVILSAVGFLLARSIGLPLQLLAEASKKVIQGNYNAMPDFSKFSGEPRLLADSMERMIAEIKNKIGFSNGVLNAITMPYVVADKEGRLLNVNQEFIDILGHTGKADDYIGSNLGEFVYGDRQKETITHKAIMSQKSIRKVEGKLPTQKGGEVDILADAAPIYDLDGNLLAGFGIFNDLTEIKSQQRLIEAQNEKIASTARQALSVADQMAGAAEQLSAQVEQSSRGTDIQRERIAETATSMEEMNSTVLEVARNASGAAEGTDSAKNKAEEGRTVVENSISAISQVQEQTLKLKENMQSLGQQAEDIGNVMNVISDIADQTNLLALNAAIEAARAGEAGRGFAVVADEVRKLAEKTMTATKEVGEAIANIQEGTRGAVTDMDNAVNSVEEATSLAKLSGDALREIVGMVETASDQVRSIATASEEQSASSEEINMAVGEVNRISRETAEAMDQSTQAISDLARLAQELSRLVRDLQEGQ